ncbi:MAG: type II secretion system GspH family protein [Kiritimatiellaeota bacterium]|nr:type II secretion system GspH family protein [Kiritimatiellota bacterium]
MKTKNRQGFTLVELLVVIGILGILSAALFPAISSAMLRANQTAVGARGRDIYVAIVGANTEREPLGLGNVWPKTQQEGGGGSAAENQDIASMSFQTSSDYFYELYDGQKVGQQDHSPYIAGFDYSKLAGAGVRAKSGTGKLTAENNMWTIGGNVRDEMEDIIPILVTRNINCTSLKKDLQDASVNTKLEWHGTYKAPFSNKGFVMVRKGGGIFTGSAKYATINVVYANQSFRTSIQGGNSAEFTYLGPNELQQPGS